MLCRECKFSKKIPGDAHISCDRKNVQVFNINTHGVENGWFFFPFNFDPIWADSCDGFVSENFNFSVASENDIVAMYLLERDKIDLNKNGKTIVRDKNTFSEYQKKVYSLDKKEDFGKSLTDKMKNLVNQIWAEGL